MGGSYFFNGPPCAGAGTSPQAAAYGWAPVACGMGGNNQHCTGPAPPGMGNSPKSAGHGGAPRDPTEAARGIAAPARSYTALNLNNNWSIGGISANDARTLVSKVSA